MESLVDVITEMAAVLHSPDRAWTPQERGILSKAIRLAKKIERDQQKLAVIERIG